MKVILIDDESRARNVLKTLLIEECNGVSVILEASNLKEGVSIINKESPDIVFLDVEMPQQSGLEIMDYFKDETIEFQIIFTTAYSQYAIEAFKISAIDYLNKLKKLEKAFQHLSINKIALEVPKGIIFTSHDEIIFFEADGVYTKVHLKDGKSELICKTLKHFSEQLIDNPFFYKPHRSYLINLKFMNKVTKQDGYHIVMNNKTTIPIARDRKDDFLKMVTNVFK